MTKYIENLLKKSTLSLISILDSLHNAENYKWNHTNVYPVQAIKKWLKKKEKEIVRAGEREREREDWPDKQALESDAQAEWTLQGMSN